MQRRRSLPLITLLITLPAAAACGPAARIPRESTYHDVLPSVDSGAMLARTLAPVLYLQRDETFPLERVVAVVHPTRPIIAYHLLWRDDAHGAWLPFTVPTDEEVIWVGYDSTQAPTDVWTYWHGHVLHTPWPKRQVAVDVQWGKHGSLPRGTVDSDLPVTQRLGFFYAFTYALPDYWLGRLNRPGPLCFCRGFRRYREFTLPMPLAPRITAVVRTARPEGTLAAVFGDNYSQKRLWP